MNILSEEYQEVLQLLVHERWQGNEFVAFPANSQPISIDDLVFFADAQQASEYCTEMGTDRHPYSHTATRSAYRTMAEAMQDHSLLIEREGSTDISSMIAARENRLIKEATLAELESRVHPIDLPSNNYPIPRHIMEGFDIPQLLDQFKTMPWPHLHSNDPMLFQQGQDRLKDIQILLERLCQMPAGKAAGRYIWGAYAPVPTKVPLPHCLHELQHNCSLQKNEIMNEANYDYLKNQLKFTGFGDSHADALKANLQKKQPEFLLTHKATFGKDEVAATLHFRKSDQSDMYFFNKYNVFLKPEGSDDAMKHMVYLRNKQDNITFKEAYNLLSDRSVFKEKLTKEGERYHTWVKLDFKDTDKEGNFKEKSQSYGYNLEKALEKYPIVEMKDPDVRSQIIASLERGNRQSVTLDQGGTEVKMFIEANPASGVNHALKVYDTNMQRMQGLSNSEKEGQTQSEQKKERGQKEQQSKSSGDDAEAPGGKKKQQKSGRRIRQS